MTIFSYYMKNLNIEVCSVCRQPVTMFINVFFDYRLFFKFVRRYNLLKVFRGAATFESTVTFGREGGGGYFRHSTVLN